MDQEREQLLPYIPPERSAVNYGTTSTEEPQKETMGIKSLTINRDSGEGSTITQYIAALSATLGALAAGAVLGFTSPTEQELRNGDLGFKISVDDFSWVGSLTPLGCMIMCIPVGSLMDLIGRKMTMLAVILVFTLGWALIIWANGVGMLMAGRFFTGMAGGTFCVAAPLYTSEIAQKEIRGTLGSYFQLMITIGILLVYVVGEFARPQIVAVVCGIIPFVFGLAFVFMPESPVHLLKKGSTEKATKSLQWLRGGADISNELKEMQDMIDEDKRTPVSIRDSFRKTATRKATLICFALMFFQQFSGINAVIFYTSSIFQDAGVDLDPKIASIIVGVMQVIATLISTLIIDRLGRRILLLLSSSVMAICTLLLGIFFTLKTRVMTADEIKDIGFLPVLALSVFIIVFSLGYGPIPWMITSEVFPREIKSVASSAAGTFNWFLAFLVTMFFKSVMDAIGSDITFYGFTVILIIGTVFVFFVVLETKGKSLDQIQFELGGAESPRSNGVVNEGFSA